MRLLLALVALALGAPPSDQEVIYFNARMALREGQPTEAVQLWLLRNAVEDKTHVVSQYDADFHSVTWAALGDLGLCQDGHPKDDEGAGLWPLALYNQMVRTMGRRRLPVRARPFDSFEVNRQQRFIAIGDVPGSKELETLRLSRGRCFGPRWALILAGELPTARLDDRQVVARVLLSLLDRSRETLAHERVRGEAVLDARRFDILLKLAELAAREAREKARDQALRARQLGLSRESVDAIREEAPETTLTLDSEAGRILLDCVHWPISEWMALSPQRRLFLFDHAEKMGVSEASLHHVAQGILDALIEAGDGEGATLWIPRATDEPRLIWSGARGAALLNLDPESGFTERGVIALHRGVDQLEDGQIPQALQSFAFAMQHAPESRASEEVRQLSLRWIGHVSAQFEIDETLLTTVEALVPRREFSILLEDMLWRAAFRADAASFQRGQERLGGRGALNRRVSLLAPLSEGELGAFLGQVRLGLTESPSETLRFLEQLLERLETEDAVVRAAQLPTLRQLRGLLQDLPTEGENARQVRTVEELLARSQGLIEGLEGLGLDASVEDRARSLSPEGEVFAGAVRLAPADPLPWPFKASEVAAPSVFTPLQLTPVEWRDGDAEWVFGWEISE
ncbi:MAG: hypothetical protein H6740_10705 [Alphaproteobacteria bacterium]|nr:hypothetical protein [Alphaproteobacteria bacterium]